MWARFASILVWIAASLLSLGVVVCLVAGSAFSYFAHDLPHPNPDISVKLQEPLRVYTAEHKLIGVYGKQKRIPVEYANIPTRVVNAFVAAEDDRFFKHPGVDFQGIVRAGIHLLVTGRKSQGGSTITMQLARDLYLSDQKTYSRKIKEIILALRLNEAYSKQKIFQLYVNKIYLGQSAYGVVAAAHTYYQEPLAQLDLAQSAMLAGLPKAPSASNPVANPSRARQRRNYVLTRMHALGMISDQNFKHALNSPVTAKIATASHSIDRFRAPYVAETVRKKMVARFGKKRAYTAGYRVVTTITSKSQRAARNAVRDDLQAYAKRHQWHGSGKSVPKSTALNKAKRHAKLQTLHQIAGSDPAIVTRIDGDHITLAAKHVDHVTIGPENNPWLRPHRAANTMVKVGDIVRLRHTNTADKHEPGAWQLTEIPNVEGALVSLDPHDGAVRALVGGYDYERSKFNRAIQARRQPGSAFKPFLYSAALANGFTTATLVNDAPVVYNNRALDKSWRPQNYSGHYFGLTRLRIGLVHSRNLVSIRVLRRIGINTAVKYASRFGLPEKQLPHNLTLALGSASLSPMQMARGYSVFANEGFLITPYLIKSIRRDGHNPIYRANPERACSDRIACPGQKQPASSGNDSEPQYAPRVIQADNAYLVGDMMRSVIQQGTGRAARKLHRKDLSGKTGTTNNQIDAWFGGFNANVVTVCWVGFDQLKPLGHHETGAHAALPMWIDYMGAVLQNKPTAMPKRPKDIVTVKINPKTGQRALHGDGIHEIFRKQHVPTKAQARRSGEHSPSSDVQSLF